MVVLKGYQGYAKGITRVILGYYRSSRDEGTIDVC